ncbi:hypothetical protein OH76DRAFT_1259881 [Lentinus brumalis]|uniref:Uncharacterized protein n=1 Tax=Lentinus brumalis TaxID=2498619 RepID=A0A371CRF4_9APHY|nr:hypothetical protein OH76DRAFT_1259881 [Polyporus brumalis]
MKSPTLESYHYKPSFGKLFQQLFEDNAISDSTLRDEACELLTVLDRPEMADYNFPSSITCQKERQPGDRTFGITMKRVVEALYLTAEEFNMPNSTRFISACICAEGRLVRVECESDADADLEAETMAAVLAGLAADWFMDIVNPFLSVELMYGETVSPFQALKEKV